MQVADHAAQTARARVAELKIIYGETDAGTDLVGHNMIEQAVCRKRAVVFNVAAHLIMLVAHAGGEKLRFRIEQQAWRLGRGGANYNDASGDLLVPFGTRALEQ